MAEIGPGEARRDRRKEAKATDKSSGYRIEGGHPARGGPRRGAHQQRTRRRPARRRSKFWLVLILVLIVVFVLLAIIGRAAGFV